MNKKQINSFYTTDRKVKRPIIFNDREMIKIKDKKITSLNEPLIFKKNKSLIKTIRYINNDTGKMRHFTPAAQE
jgi:predicted ribosome-associated RNA-binding protein Tma20